MRKSNGYTKGPLNHMRQTLGLFDIARLSIKQLTKDA